ncbi:hypothetical protein M9H77_32723 [Catharanthus roseus]|uniref:Uncharacterized protein n=1 Tax=Catharanthus roseus TaxID=4058 RepID=A0ACC0A4N0_CATRO|nr:hypothetical protein M9H77_32723 [Catharanthus roseus]
MTRGTLEVQLAGARGLENTDLLKKMDPYAIITCRTQEKKSSVATGKGSNPEWNETFLFTIAGNTPEITIKIMDSDSGSADDFVGEAIVPLDPCFAQGNTPMKTYNVVKGDKFKGEVRVGLVFTPEQVRDRGFSMQEGNMGGWRESSY